MLTRASHLHSPGCPGLPGLTGLKYGHRETYKQIAHAFTTPPCRDAVPKNSAKPAPRQRKSPPPIPHVASAR